jgi:hypothetical protein
MQSSKSRLNINKMVIIYIYLFIIFMKTMYEFYFIHLDYLKYPLRRIELDSTVVFYKLAALCSSLAPQERTNAPTEALIDVLYSCRLIIATILMLHCVFHASRCQKQLIIGKKNSDTLITVHIL